MESPTYKKSTDRGLDGQSSREAIRQSNADRYVCLKRALSTALTMAFVVYLLATSLYLLAPVWSAVIRSGNGPVVSVKNGSYVGIHSAEYNQDFFLGIPYAKTPERFRIAEGLDSAWNGTRSAKEYPKHCIGYGEDHVGYDMSEDCLQLNVIRPAGVAPDADLPVAVWIHGGGLYMGGSADKRYNLTFIVQNSVEQGTPLIGVSFNYRLSVFGFPGGKEALEAGATNLGFRDQRLALRWVNENIASFGGSADKVAIFGESSGAESVSAQVLAYNGRNDGLFRAAAAQSGFGGIIPRMPGGFNSTDLYQANYDTFVAKIPSCSSTVGIPESLECLRTAPLEEFNAVLGGSDASPKTTFTFIPFKDGDFIADFATNQIARGDFVKVPVLIGTNTDEGSAFGQGKGPNAGPINTDEDMRWAVANIIRPQSEETTGQTIEELVNEVLELYPDDQAVGIPSLETWPHVVQPGEDIAVTRGLQQRRGGAFFGDVLFQCLRRRANIAWSEHNLPSYAYRFDVTTAGTPDYIGSVHFAEVAFVFHNLDGLGYATNPFGGDDPVYTEKAKALAKTMSSAWINFFVGLDPNGAPGLSSWPAYEVGDEGVGSDVVFGIEGAVVETDDWRKDGMDWLIKHALDILGN
ncbi:Lipase 1-like protein 2 [Colletotrichum chlorophyti]|uniref:Carboxylic ester hydrolase n=1 Tax=Colletotrichum chlorophyti TaxID=708187 RepID=A0A1Q8S350_9PEZI|nr:Lipase 1-like protein 2 [Colletotrichum chlorophyti]